jgi:hypothetical protein
MARMSFAGAEISARGRWHFGRTPRFDARRPAGPFTTLVGFLPESFAVELAESVATLPALGAHFRYPSGQLHVTIRNLDGVDLVTLPRLLERLQPIGLRADRLGFTPQTLLLRLVTADPTLGRLRTQLDDLPGAHHRGLPQRDLVFANVLRLNGPVTAEMRRGVRHQRNSLTGRQLEIDRLTLVRTDKVGSPERTEVLGHYDLRR